jgi:hypothetical protein
MENYSVKFLELYKLVRSRRQESVDGGVDTTHKEGVEYWDKLSVEPSVVAAALQSTILSQFQRTARLLQRARSSKATWMFRPTHYNSAAGCVNVLAPGCLGAVIEQKRLCSFVRRHLHLSPQAAVSRLSSRISRAIASLPKGKSLVVSPARLESKRAGHPREFVRAARITS